MPTEPTTSPTPRTRPPLERIYRIHELVLRKKFPNCKTIAAEIEVTQKTIQRDISFMRNDLDLPIEYDATRHGYLYTRPVQDFPFLKTTAEDIVALFLARKALESLDGTPLEASLKQSFRRFASNMPEQFSFPWADLDQAFSVHSPGKVRTEAAVLEKLANAILETRELRFDYRKPGAANAESRSLRPFHLTDIDGGWYVIGFDPLRKARRTFAVQRISALRVLKSKFARPSDFDLAEHLGGSFGVWQNPQSSQKNLTTVRLRFTGWAANVIPERRWHPSQQIKILKTKQHSVEMRLELSSFEDVTRWILSWGANSEVLEPENLRHTVRDELDRAQKRYRQSP